MTDTIDRPEVEAGSRWQRVAASEWTRTFAMVVAFHFVLTAVAVLFQRSYPTEIGYPKDIIGPDPTWLSHTFRWDSAHYYGILDGSYENPEEPAFYPLFPVVVWLVRALSFNSLPLITAGFLVNFVASWFAATALLRIARTFLSSTWGPWLAVTAFLTAPTAYFLHGFYSESLFCALGFWAYLFALRRQWHLMGAWLIPLTAIRITSVLFVGLCFLEFFRAQEWQWRKLLSWNVLWFPAAFIGLEAYALYLKLAYGDALAMFHAYDLHQSWPYHVFSLNFPGTIWHAVTTAVEGVFAKKPPDNWTLVSDIIPVLALVALGLAAGYVLRVCRGAGIPLAVFGFVSIVMFTLNSNVVSVHRYVLPCLVVYIAMARLAERAKPFVYGLILTHTVLMAFLYSLFVAGKWSG